MAMSMLSRTIMLITLYDPNMSNAQNRVKLLIPCRSKAIKSTNPNEAQNSDWDVSKRLQKETNPCQTTSTFSNHLSNPYLAKRLQMEHAFSWVSKSGTSFGRW